MTNPDSANNRGGRLDWRQVGILYTREMRAALRDRTIVVNSILIPIFLYPFILWLAFTGIMYVQGQTEGFVSRVVAQGWPKGHPGLRRSLERDEKIQLVKVAGPASEIERKLRDGELDAWIEFLPATNAPPAYGGNFRARVSFNESKERSGTARERLASILDRYREDWLRREGGVLGISPPEWRGFNLSTRNLASGKQMGAFILGRMLPLLFVVMVAVGCFYPAVDSTAGEHERNTWETLMSTAANRVGVVTAKYLFVASLGGLAGGLNLLAMILTMKPILAPLLAKTGDTMVYTVPLAALPLMILAALLLAGFVAAGMMIFASFARTFKEGQAMVTPFYLIVMLPVLFLQAPGLKFTLPLAFVPIVNVTLMVRDVIAGAFPWAQIGVTVTVSVVLIAACVRCAAFILRFEDLMSGAYRGGFYRFFGERVLGRAKSTTHTGALPIN